MVITLEKHEKTIMDEMLKEARAVIESLEHRLFLLDKKLETAFGSAKWWAAISIVTVVMLTISSYVVTEIIAASPQTILVIFSSDALIVALIAIWSANFVLMKNMEYRKRTYDYLIETRRRINRINLMSILEEKRKHEKRT